MSPDPSCVRLENRGHATACWIWLKAINPHTRYGQTTLDGVKTAAHRAFYIRAKGPAPKGLQIDHLCRIRACVNPDHLEAVTQKENVRRGDSTKLIFADVQAIRGANKGGMNCTEISKLFGVDKSYVSRICTGKVRVHD